MFSKIKKLKESLSKTRDNIFGKIGRLVSGRKIDDDLIDEIEEILLKADIGVGATDKIIENLREQARAERIVDSDEVFRLLKQEMTGILVKNRKGTLLDNGYKPAVWLITGVNGTGKTTTVGKLAQYFKADGKSVMIAACDTFRAAAVEQLGIWAERSGVDFVKAHAGADPAAVAFDAATAAKNRGIDLLIIDTAGRLHTKANLMEELKKIRRVTEKVIPSEHIYSKLIIDGTTGQNAVSQVKVFTEAVGCDGLIVTKLDGTAKGGIMIAIAEELSVPVDFIGIGEKIEDLQPFDAQEYVEALFES
ncbi:MAG: signal recognition particle-docking protein FtsY [candidate division Zixibacteria bacterium HGW-Zixibacteria-1]|nr:MAG: signal recognition particle-docking protein FtsY [candidate division Zixibacteria bacterium HGW-Zixibacteria-1]